MASNSADPLPDAATALVALVWLGILMGVSFLATPVKFQAPSLALPVALDVGRVTFAAFSKVEWGLAALLFMAALFSRGSRAVILFAAIAVLVVALQALWLLPALGARVEAVLAGQSAPPSMHHMLYAALEVAKGLALAAIALVALFRLGWRNLPGGLGEAP